MQYWAATTSGNATYAQHATQHGLTTIDHLVRPDRSSFHVVDFHTNPTRDDNDPNTATLGEKYNLANPFKGTYQGYWHDSTWSRGQAWGIHGFTSAAAVITPGAARDEHLQTAQRMADWFIDHLPADHIPLWDFDVLSGRPADFDVNAPNIGLKDASAAAIAASGLLDLVLLVDDMDDKLRYFTAAEEILLALSQDPYLNLGSEATDGTILLQSVRGYVQNPVYSKVPYADYSFMNAVLKYDRVSATVPEPAVATVMLLMSVVMTRRRLRLRD